MEDGKGSSEVRERFRTLREINLLKVSHLLFLKEEVCTLGPQRRLDSCSSRFGRRT